MGKMKPLKISKISPARKCFGVMVAMSLPFEEEIHQTTTQGKMEGCKTTRSAFV